MAFRIAPLRIPNMSTDFGNVGALTANIGQQFLGGIEQGRKQAEETETRALLGEAMKTGDFTKAGQALLARGKIEQGAALIGLGQKAQERQAEQEWLRGNSTLGRNATGGTPAVSIPTVAKPKQGVHVAETEEDVQRLERATGMVTTDADKEAIVKTVYGEAANQPAVGQQAVAAVIRNRANQAGLTPEQITRERNQFEPWNTEAGRARMNSIPEQRFQQIAGTVAPVIEQGLDPTGGATHFYAPKAQAALGRPAPKWDNGTGNDIADHRFFSLGYGQGGGAPAPAPQAIIASAQGLPEPPAQVAQAPGFLGNEPPPATAFAPQGQPAPSQVAQAPAQSQGAALPGDDPIRLRQEAAYYERSNPEAARQLRARADVAERQVGVQTAQARDPRADQPPASGSPTSTEPGFVIPGTTPQQTRGILADPDVQAARERYMRAPTERTRAIAKQDLDLAVENAKAVAAADGPTGDIKEYNLYRRQALARGDTPEDFTAWTRGNKAAGAAKTTVQIDQTSQTEYAKANGKAISERFSKIVEEGDAAAQEAGAIARLRELGGKIENMGAGAALQARLAEYGIKVGPNVSEIEAYNAIIDKLTPQQRIAGAGATSDFDAKMFKGSLPGLVRTPGGNELILGTMEALNTYKRQRADIVAEAMALNEKPGDVLKRLKELPDPFAAFKEFRKSGVAVTPSGQAAPPAQPSPVPQPSAPPSGAPRTATNPNTGERIMLDPATGQWVPYT